MEVPRTKGTMLTRVDPGFYIGTDCEKIPRLGKGISRSVRGKGGAPLEEMITDGAWLERTHYSARVWKEPVKVKWIELPKSPLGRLCDNSRSWFDTSP